MTFDFRLVVFDIDGTLENSHHEVSPYTRSIIQRAQKAGLIVSLATGKTLPAVQSLAQQLQLTHPLVLGNGSLLQSPHGDLLHASVFPRQTVERVLQLAGNFEVDICVFTTQMMYVQNLTPGIHAMLAFGAPFPREIRDWSMMGADVDRVVKIVLINLGGAPALAPLVHALDSRLGDEVSHFPSQPFIHEVLPPGEDKGRGVKRLADALGIEMQYILAFGDGDNDAVVLKLAGLGVAVANASALCKSSADVIVDSNDRDGPARFLEGFLKTRL